MTRPSKQVWGLVLLRDSFRCVSCGSTIDLTFQHREASGMGGRGPKAPTLTTADGVVLCLPCNEACEAEGQQRALALGWKLRRNRGRVTADQIPYYDRNDGVWYLPTVRGTRVICTPAVAAEIITTVNPQPGTVT